MSCSVVCILVLHWGIARVSKYTNWTHRRGDEGVRADELRALPCFMLTLSLENDSVVDLGGVPCRVVRMSGFREGELDDVRADVREQLVTHRMQRFDNYVMANNNTVNIFHNHVALWRLVARSQQAALLVEDDALPVDGEALLRLLRHMRTQRALRRYVLKLQNAVFHTFFRWRQVRIGDTEAYQCVCTPPFVNFGTAAYIMDPEAASTLLAMYTPIWTHVDAWLHVVGCAQYVQLLSTPYNMFEETGRPSVHRTAAEIPTVIEKIVHLASNIGEANCSDAS